MIYKLITPSDPITLKADDDKIAYVCAIILSNGKAGCKNVDTNTSLDCMFMFASEEGFIESTTEYLGVPIEDFMKDNRPAISECFKSFSYGSPAERKTYDNAIEAITDPDKLKEFKAKHEDENRTSLSQWVKAAWQYGERFSTVTT